MKYNVTMFIYYVQEENSNITARLFHSTKHILLSLPTTGYKVESCREQFIAEGVHDEVVAAGVGHVLDEVEMVEVSALLADLPPHPARGLGTAESQLQRYVTVHCVVDSWNIAKHS